MLQPPYNLHLDSSQNPCCRFCKSVLRHTFADLGVSPLANNYLTADQLNKAETFYPLHAYVCDGCLLVQVEAFETPARIFNDYAYYSSYSDTWLAHSKGYAEMAVERFRLNRDTLAVEIASNDGYLLQYFRNKDIPVLGIEPASDVAHAAIAKGIPTCIDFFGTEFARRLVAEGRDADLIIANNVLAHVPNLNDFVKGLKLLLKPGGAITLEFPHLMRLIEGHQFDTIYQEHFSYFSFQVVVSIFDAHGLTVYDVEELRTHGGSLRIYARHSEDTSKPLSANVAELRARETQAGLSMLQTYVNFAEKIKLTKRKLLEFLIDAKRQSKSIAGYGAPAKGNTLLNYCGVRTDFIDYTVDRNPQKQGRFLPGTHIPIYHPDKIKDNKPDYLLILPWNLKDEVMKQMAHIRDWGGQFVVPIPEVKIL